MHKGIFWTTYKNLNVFSSPHVRIRAGKTSHRCWWQRGHILTSTCTDNSKTNYIFFNPGNVLKTPAVLTLKLSFCYISTSRPPPVTPVSNGKEGKDASSLTPEYLVLLADKYLMEMPLEALQSLKSENIASLSRDFSLQLLYHRITHEEPQGELDWLNFIVFTMVFILELSLSQALHRRHWGTFLLIWS